MWCRWLVLRNYVFQQMLGGQCPKSYKNRGLWLEKGKDAEVFLAGRYEVGPWVVGELWRYVFQQLLCSGFLRTQ